MAALLVVLAVATAVFTALAVLAVAGFRNGDFTGEALARALRRDLEAAAAKHDHSPPCD